MKKAKAKSSVNERIMMSRLTPISREKPTRVEDARRRWPCAVRRQSQHDQRNLNDDGHDLGERSYAQPTPVTP